MSMMPAFNHSVDLTKPAGLPPEGRAEHSPMLQLWERVRNDLLVPKGRLIRRSAPVSRPFGTNICLTLTYPKAEALGYARLSLRETNPAGRQRFRTWSAVRAKRAKG